ncbi:Kiwa anti-phage protein KwaB-like domain-containing protein [Halobacteriaceae archaeon GCM10025711]
MGAGLTRELLVARKQDTDPSSFEFGEVPIHRPIGNDIHDLVKNRLEEQISEVQDAKKTIEEYKLSNIHRDPTPVQYCPRDDFPMFDKVEELLTGSEFSDSSYEEPRPDFQVIRLSNRRGKHLLAFRMYTNHQIIKMNRRALMVLKGKEYNKVGSGELVKLPKKIDAIYFDGIFFVFRQRNFEDSFDWVEELEEKANETFDTIEDSDVLIHNMGEFRERVFNHRTKMRKLYEVSENGITSDLDLDTAKDIIDKFGLNLTVKKNGAGEEGIELPDGNAVWDVIRLFNNDHLVSPVDASRFQVFGKEKR